MLSNSEAPSPGQSPLFSPGPADSPKALSPALPPGAVSGIGECCGLGDVEECVSGSAVPFHRDSHLCGESLDDAEDLFWPLLNLELFHFQQGATVHSASASRRWGRKLGCLGATPASTASTFRPTAPTTSWWRNSTWPLRRLKALVRSERLGSVVIRHASASYCDLLKNTLCCAAAS